MAVERNVGQTGIDSFACRFAGNVASLEGDVAARDGHQAQNRFAQLELSVAFDSGDAHDLTRAHAHGHVVECQLRSGHRPLHIDAGHFQQRGGSDRRFASGRVRQIAAHHQLGQSATVGLSRSGVGHGGALTDDRDFVAIGQHLVELVRDEDDGGTFGDEPLQGDEQFDHFLRDEHGRGFVEDENLGAAIQHLQDLDALSLSDTEAGNGCVEVELHPESRHELADSRMGAGEIDSPARCHRFVAENDVLGDGEVVGQHEVLVNHSDAGRDGVGGGAKRASGSVDGDGSLVGLVHAVQRLHQRGLAGTVLADDRVNGARTNREVHIMVGDDAGEGLGDSTQLDREVAARERLFRHGSPRSSEPVIAESPGRRPGLSRTAGCGTSPPFPDQGAVGTSISPAMIAALISSS